MKTVAVFLFLACFAICHCWTPHGRANAGKREDSSLAIKNTNIDARGDERRIIRCICKSHGPQKLHQKRRHKKAARSKPSHDHRCRHVCNETRMKHGYSFDVSMPLS